LPLLAVANGSDDEAGSTMVATAVGSDSNQALPAPLPTAPLRSDPTLSATSTASPESQPWVAANQLRDPERYQILCEHGRGGLGRVSRAHDRSLGRDVAIKELISPGRVGELRFVREALITARLEHPGIVPIHEAGRWPDGTPFYAMKLVAGRPLRDLIAERTTVDQRIGLLHHVIAVADAIAYAHGRNIIHRDLKPANVIVGDFGETIVIDWGLAKDLSASEESAIGASSSGAAQDRDLTAAGAVVGTPSYMAPEQERGEHVDQRADVFAIGAMLWELCSLQRVPPTNLRLRHRLLRRAGIDRDLAVIIDKALDPDPNRRYPTAGTLAADLKAFMSGARIAARNYSLFAMLSHWTRRHRAIALATAFVASLLIAGTALYVRNISAERDRTDATLVVAQRELERAQLAEAALLLEKDPTSARHLLASVSTQSPQHALLSSRATLGSATRVIRLPARASRLLRNRASAEIVVLTIEGDLAAVDVDAGTLRPIARNLLGPITSYGDSWLYARRPFGAPTVTLTETGKPQHSIDAGLLLSDFTGALLGASRTYVLDKHDLYVLDNETLIPILHGVRSIAGNDHVLMICTTTDVLDIEVDGVSLPRQRCAKNMSFAPMAVAGTSYAALVDSQNLLLVRDDKSLMLSTHISGQYQLALSEAGLLAVADFSDKTWLVRPQSDRLELAPVHASLPTSVAVAQSVAAWGYADGVVIAIDTSTNTTWKFKGHNTQVAGIVIDLEHKRLISNAGLELRVWPLERNSLTELFHLPCTVYNIGSSFDHKQAAMDCYDGAVRVWTFATSSIAEMHRHRSASYSVAWWRDRVCSGGFDGAVKCTWPDGTTQVVFTSSGQTRWVISNPDRQRLIIAPSDGTLKEFDGSLNTLYSHDSPVYRMAFSFDGQLLASGADDGSVIVYNISRRQIVGRLPGHTARVMTVTWHDRDLWTASADGTMQHWRYQEDMPLLIDRTRESGSFRFLHAFKDGWSGNIDGRYLVVKRASSSRVLRFDLGRHVERIDVSPDERYIATAVAGEVVIVDLLQNSVASLTTPFDGIGYVGFTEANLLVISASNGLHSVHVDRLHYYSFDSNMLHSY
jgi:eukaryotic-like serine/threonine-protein kinase